MPIYEYLCQACGDEFEALQKYNDPPLKSCACGKKGKVQRKLSLSAFHLQGGGWYKDDYGRGASPGNTPTNGNGGSDKAKEKSETGGDSSSQAKSESKGSEAKSKSDGGDSGAKSKPEGTSSPA